MGSHQVVTKTPKPTVEPIQARKGETIDFDGGTKGRTYFFPQRQLFGEDQQQVLPVKKNGTIPLAVEFSGPRTEFRYAIWDDDAGDFLEGNSSPIIIVQP